MSNLIRRQNIEKLVSWNNCLSKQALIQTYYLVVDSSSDLPYDFYRPGEENERLPIYLKMPNGELSELSRSSDIVDAISGKRRTDHKIYFPEDLLEAGKEENPLYRTDFTYVERIKKGWTPCCKNMQKLCSSFHSRKK